MNLPRSTRKSAACYADYANNRFRMLPCDGTYFQTVDYSAISDLPEANSRDSSHERDRRLAIPVSAFYRESHESGVVRFFASRRRKTLQLALDRLAKL